MGSQFLRIETGAEGVPAAVMCGDIPVSNISLKTCVSLLRRTTTYAIVVHASPSTSSVRG